MNKDIYNLYSAYTTIYENTDTNNQPYTQESLNQMDVNQLIEIYNQRKAYRDQLNNIVRGSSQRMNPIRL